MRVRPMLGLFAVALLLTGCAGARYAVLADRLKYPASLSPALPDDKGKPLFLGEELLPVGEFTFRRTSVGFLYGATGTDIDISHNLNGEVERRRGEGIVRLSFRAVNCTSSYFFPFTLLPFYPGCQNLTVTGTVVTRKPSAGVAGRSGP